MSNILGRLYYIITGDTASLERNLASSRKEIRALGTQLNETSRSILNFAKGTITAVLIRSLTDAASRAEEMQNRFDTVFGSMSQEVEDWADTYAAATSRGRLETMEFLAAQQDIRTGFGDTTEGAAEFSRAVVGITNDLASFANVPVPEAIAAVNSGLNGEFEALRRLGIGLNVAILNQMEYTQSIGKTWDEMDNLERQEAILSGIVSQSGNALHQNITLWQEYDYTLGDAAATSGSFANQMQGFTQTLTDFRAEVGDELLPIATELLGAVTGLMRGFNDLDDSMQTVIVSAAAVGASVLAIGGPLGVAVGAVAGLSIGLSNIRTSEERLKDATESLSSATSEYKRIINDLSGDTSDLTDAERSLLEVRAELARNKAEVAMANLAKEWVDSSAKIETAISNETRAQAELDALMLLKSGGLKAVSESLDELKDKGAELTDYEREFSSKLIDIQNRPVIYFTDLADSILEASSAATTASADTAKAMEVVENGIYEMAIAYNAGVIDLSAYAIAYPELTEEILKTAEEIRTAEEEIERTSETTAKAATVTREWRDALREQRAEMLEADGRYEESYRIKEEMLRAEQEAAVRQLALDSGIIESGENVADLTIESLRERLAASEETNAELLALDEYYANETIRLQKDLQNSLDETAEKRKTNAEEVASLLQDQARDSKEAAAVELEEAGRFEEALEIRKALIEEERDKAIAAMEAKVAAGEATEAEIAGLNEYYDNLIRASEAENDKLREEYHEKELDRLEEEARLRAENSKEIEAMLDRQRRSADERAAAELESAGAYEEALAMRIALINEERDAAIAALEEKVAANEASLEDIAKTNEYYDNEIAKAEEETAERIQKALDETAAKRRRNADETIGMLRDQRREGEEEEIRELEDAGMFEEALEIRKRLINEERNLDIAAMAEKVALNEATQEDIDRINEYYDNEILKAEEETADAIARMQEEQVRKAEETYRERLRAQQEAAKEGAAAELESLGDFGGALEIRMALIEEERQREIEALKEKKLAAEEYAEELAALNAYYDSEILAAKDESNQREIEAEQQKAEELKDINRELFNSLLRFVQDFSSAIGDLYSAITERRLQQIDEETDAALEALGLQEDSETEKLEKEYAEAVKNGDMELAQEKERELQRARIEEEAEERKKRLQREEAQRSKQLAIFQATIDTLASVIGFMSDPGGLSGIAMSAMAAATGAAQIAAIAAEPLPSYSVGAVDIDRDQIAQLHQGELVVPKTFAQGIRDGDISIGGSESRVEVMIVNNTGARATADRLEDGDVTKLRITIGETVASEISKGRLDSAMMQRFQITRRNPRG